MINKKLNLIIITFAFLIINFFSFILMSPHDKSVEIAACKLDCAWYMGIAKNGYSESAITEGIDDLGEANWAFFPAYPLLVRFVSYITTINYHVSGLLVNYTLWPFLVFLCIRNLSAKNIHVNEILFCLALSVYPLNVWYFSQYSEALYGVLLIFSVILLRENKVNLSALFCCILSLARPTGFFMTIGLALWWLYKNRNQNGLRDSLLLIVSGGFGLSLFVLYLSSKIGDGFAFSHVQIAWGREFKVFPFHILNNLYNHIHTTSTYIAIFTIFLSILMFFYGWRLESFLVGLTIIIACSTGVKSIGRIVFANPLTIEFLAYIFVILNKNIRYFLFFLLAFLHFIVIYFWIYGYKFLE